MTASMKCQRPGRHTEAIGVCVIVGHRGADSLAIEVSPGWWNTIDADGMYGLHKGPANRPDHRGRLERRKLSSMRGNIISYIDMCREEGSSLQRGMNFRLRGGHSVVLMSVHPNAPYRTASKMTRS